MQIKNIVVKNCHWCNSPLLKKTSKKYCDIHCQVKYLYMNNFLDWYLELSNSFDNNALRKHLETRYGHECSNCKITNWRGFDIVFDVDHINGDSNNNGPDNVRLLCQNCHSQTENFSYKNKGQGRYSLKKELLNDK